MLKKKKLVIPVRMIRGMKVSEAAKALKQAAVEFRRRVDDHIQQRLEEVHASITRGTQDLIDAQPLNIPPANDRPRGILIHAGNVGRDPEDPDAAGPTMVIHEKPIHHQEIPRPDLQKKSAAFAKDPDGAKIPEGEYKITIRGDYSLPLTDRGRGLDIPGQQVFPLIFWVIDYPASISDGPGRLWVNDYLPFAQAQYKKDLQWNRDIRLLRARIDNRQDLMCLINYRLEDLGDRLEDFTDSF